MTRCAAHTNGGSGKKCKKQAICNSKYCYIHHQANKEAVDTVENMENDNYFEGYLAEDSVTEEEILVNEPLQITSFQDDLDFVTKRIVSLKLEVKRLQKVKESIEKFGRVLTKAKWIFYHENKSNPEVLEDVRSRLKMAGLYSTLPMQVNGQTIMKENIPHVIIKTYTDNAFNSMDDMSKAPFIAQAVSSLNISLEMSLDMSSRE